MRAVRVHGPGDLRVERVPVPVPGAGDVLVRVRAVGICTTDRKLAARGTPGTDPRILGHEIVGEIVVAGGGGASVRVAVAPNVGEGTCRWCEAGATNYCAEFRAFGIHLDGGMAEYLLVPRHAAAAGHLIPLPESIDDERSALLEPLACCVEGLTASGLRAGENVLVVGAGAMGRLHVAAALALGAGRVVVIGRNAERLEHARALGAAVVIDEAADDAEGVTSQVLAATGGDGVDVAAVTVGDARAIEAAIAMLATGGRLNVFAGVPAGARLSIDPNPLHYRHRTVLGTTGASLPTFRTTLALLAAGRVSLDGMVSATFVFERAVDAFEAAARSEHARVLLVPEEGA
ncbi:zinc-dependent dehydrogenase [soil metagenome]